MIPRKYFERQINILDKIMQQMEAAPNKQTAKIYAIMAEDSFDDLRYNNVDLDYKAYKERIIKYK